jgi:hypothetical protein
MYRRSGESIDHLLLHCKVTRIIECDLYLVRSPLGYACKGGTGVKLLARSDE